VSATARCCVMTAGGPEAWTVINYLAGQGYEVSVFLERKERRLAMLRRRVRLCGWKATAAQLATMCAISVVRPFFAGRRQKIFEDGGAEPCRRASYEVHAVESINDVGTAAALQAASPDVVLSFGCRLMTSQTIAGIGGVPLLNLHPAILPQYRGHHGGYWALALADEGNFGCTVHLVDAGADTGTIVRQARGAPEPKDNIITYQARLALLAGPLAAAAIEDVLGGRMSSAAGGPSSKHRFQPSPFGYIATGLRRGVW
jgi:methionyl-tRNA formyltransferase